MHLNGKIINYSPIKHAKFWIKNPPQAPFLSHQGLVDAENEALEIIELLKRDIITLKSIGKLDLE